MTSCCPLPGGNDDESESDEFDDGKAAQTWLMAVKDGDVVQVRWKLLHILLCSKMSDDNMS